MHHDPRAFAREVFGSSPRLRLLVWIAEHDTPFFSQRDACVGVGYAQGSISRLLSWLAEWGLLTKGERNSGRQPLHYTRNESAWWEAFRTVGQALHEPVSRRTAVKPVIHGRVAQLSEPSNSPAGARERR